MNRIRLILDNIKKNSNIISFISGPIISIIVSNIISTFEVKKEQCRMIGLLLVMIIWWISLCIKIGITSLLPLILIPILGIDSGSSIATSYFEDSIVTCFGSLLISDAVEHYNLHRKFANIFLSRANKYGLNGILGSFLFCSGFLSMFLSNSATAALMTPLAKAIMNELKLSKTSQEEIIQLTMAAKAIDISIAYGSTIGGQATITGTGANLVLKGLMLEKFGEKGEINYLDWLSIAFPLSIINLFLLWMILYLYFLRNIQKVNIVKEYNEDYHQIEMTCKSPIDDNNDNEIKLHHDNNEIIIDKQIISNTQPSNKKFTFPEFITITIFLLMVILWITRDPPGRMGWGRLFWIPEYITDGTVAIFCATCLLIVPSNPNIQILNKFFDKSDTTNEHMWENVLDFSVIGKHWEVLFLLGAGFAISRGFQKSGLEITISNLVVNSQQNESKSLSSLVSSASVSACAITNVMSNVAAANILLPAFICIGPNYSKPVNPLLVLFPVTLSVSLALMFPFGTPPNSIIMSNKNVEVKDLAIVGSICTVIFLSTTLIAANFVIPYMIGNEVNETIINACKL